jgi:hypothetical protein
MQERGVFLAAFAVAPVMLECEKPDLLNQKLDSIVDIKAALNGTDVSHENIRSHEMAT